jgi:chromate transporter
LTSFGGPIAHLGYFRQEFVERRKWLSEPTFADLVALCNFLPGTDQQSGLLLYRYDARRDSRCHFRLERVYDSVGDHHVASRLRHPLAERGTGSQLAHGLKVVAVAVVAQAVWAMATRLCTDRTRISFAFVAAVIILLTNSSWVQVLTIALGALAGWKLIRAEGPPKRSEMFTRLPSRIQSVGSMAVFAVCPAVRSFSCAGKRDGWLPLFDSFYRTGSLVFGGGHVVLPLLQAEVVPRGWLDNSTFLAGYGIAQALPGPLFSFATYLGAAKSGSPNGWLPGLWCLFAILLPPILLVTSLLPLWNRLRASAAAQSLLAGANATVVGILLAALYQPIWTSAIDSAKSLALAFVRFADLEDSALDPRPDRRGNRWNLFVRTCETKILAKGA